MLDAIVEALRAHPAIDDWSVRQISSRGAQLYLVPGSDGTQPEARRVVSGERCVVEVLRLHPGPDGGQSAGSANVTLLPGDNIAAGIDRAVSRAALVHNQPYAFAGPSALPEVPLADPEIQRDPGAVVQQVAAELQRAVAAHGPVRMTAAECSGEAETVRLCNSRGIDAVQVATRMALEWVLLLRSGEQEVESFVELVRRRSADLDLAAEVARRARYTADRLSATAPPSYRGPVVMQGATLASFLTAGVLQTLASAEAKFGKATPWEIGQPVTRGEVRGDPLTVWANSRLPYGANARRFDAEGLAGGRVELIRDHVLRGFVASQRYATYLALPPTGEFGDLEVAPGRTAAADLVAEPHIEIADFSWFNPNAITGDFSSEVRLGYHVEAGRRRPFTGGALVGNVLDALADVRWSAETAFFGTYQGPTTARFGELILAGTKSSAR